MTSEWMQIRSASFPTGGKVIMTRFDLHLYIATYEAMVNAKHVAPELIRRMCIGDSSGHTGYT
jgi:hypothetical protein